MRRLALPVTAFALLTTPLLAAAGTGNFWLATAKGYGVHLAFILGVTVAFAIALALAYKLFSLFSKGLNDALALKNGNYGVAILLAIFIIAIALVCVKAAYELPFTLYPTDYASTNVAALSALERLVSLAGWIFTAALGFALGAGLTLRVFHFVAGKIDEWGEIAKGNIPVAIVLGAIVLSVAIIALALV